MKKILVVILAMAMNAHAGNEAGGGGSGIFCPAVNGVTPPAMVLDMYEGQILQNLNWTEDPTPYQKQIFGIVAKMSFDFRLQTDFYQMFQMIQKNARFLPAGVHLTAPSDLGNNNVTVIPSACHLETIGYYNDATSLLISTDAFNQLTETGKAAFFVHETLYKMERSVFPATDSEDIRPLTPKLFAMNADQLVAEQSNFAKVYWGAYFGGEFVSRPTCSPPNIYSNNCIQYTSPIGWYPTSNTSANSIIVWNYRSSNLPFAIPSNPGEAPYLQRGFFQLPKRGGNLTLEISNPLQRPLSVKLECYSKFSWPRVDSPDWKNQISDSNSGDGSHAIIFESTTDKQYTRTVTLPPDCERLHGGFDNTKFYELLSRTYESSDLSKATQIVESVHISYDGQQLLGWPAKSVINGHDYYSGLGLINFWMSTPLYYKSDLPF